MRRSFLFAALIGFSAGIILGEFFIAKLIAVAAVGVVAITMLHFRRMRLMAICILFVCIGMSRFYGWTAPKTLSLEHTIEQRVILSGSLVETPIQQNGRQVLELVRVNVGEIRMQGKVLLQLPEFPNILAGQRITVRCRLQEFPEHEKIRMRMHDIRAECAEPEIEATQPDRMSFRLALGRMKDWTVARLMDTFVDPQASLLIGILLGRQVPMPPDLSAAFQATGTTHIIALSGFNVTIMISVVSAALVQVVGKRWAWIPASVFVVLFVILTGASASVTRAGIMSIIMLAASWIGRPVPMIRLLAYTLGLMVWHNPLILMHDLGFQLSFLATIGLVYISPAIKNWLGWVPEYFSLRENLGTTLGAMIATEPLLLWHFGRVSLIAPFVNMAVLPFIPLAMGTGFISFLVSGIWPLTDMLLRAILTTIRTGASLSFASQNLSGVMAAVLVGVLSYLAIYCIRRAHANTHSLADL